MKFRFVKKIEGETLGGYQCIPMKTGDVIDIPGKFVQKAMRNPDYEPVTEEEPEKPVVRKKTKKKSTRGPGRPRKYGN